MLKPRLTLQPLHFPPCPVREKDGSWKAVPVWIGAGHRFNRQFRGAVSSRLWWLTDGRWRRRWRWRRGGDSAFSLGGGWGEAAAINSDRAHRLRWSPASQAQPPSPLQFSSHSWWHPRDDHLPFPYALPYLVGLLLLGLGSSGLARFGFYGGLVVWPVCLLSEFSRTQALLLPNGPWEWILVIGWPEFQHTISYLCFPSLVLALQRCLRTCPVAEPWCPTQLLQSPSVWFPGMLVTAIPHMDKYPSGMIYHPDSWILATVWMSQSTALLDYLPGRGPLGLPLLRVLDAASLCWCPCQRY